MHGLSRNDRIRGSLIGGAVGDALGYPVEFDSLQHLRMVFGPDGIREYVPVGGAEGVVSDDTQMTLFTVQALIDHMSGPQGALRDRMVQAYLDWWVTQGGQLIDPPAPPAGARSPLLDQPWLHVQRAPGLTIMGALDAIARLPSTAPIPDADNDSKGCGTVMRSAPFGFVSQWAAEDAFREASAAAAITHGHRTGQIAAGALAVIVRALLRERSLEDSIRDAFAALEPYQTGVEAETRLALERAVGLARQGNPTPEKVESLGGGWVAEEALAIAVYCALAFPGPRQILDALSLAVTHSGDSDSTGAVCGNILGALHGEAALPHTLAGRVEGVTLIQAMADAFTAAAGDGSRVELTDYLS